MKQLDKAFNITPEVVKEDPNNIIRLAKKHGVEEFLSLINKKQKTQIAKKEPTIKPKKKKKVKVAKTTQEEFKPETGDIDNEAPVIEIAEAITVNDSTYEIEGKVIDSSKKLFVEVDGKTIPVKKGKFKSSSEGLLVKPNI